MFILQHFDMNSSFNSVFTIAIVFKNSIHFLFAIVSYQSGFEITLHWQMSALAPVEVCRRDCPETVREMSGTFFNGFQLTNSSSCRQYSTCLCVHQWCSTLSNLFPFRSIHLPFFFPFRCSERGSESKRCEIFLGWHSCSYCGPKSFSAKLISLNLFL